MSSKSRKVSYALAINEALHQMMAEDPSVFLIGQGVKSPWYVGKTTQGLLEKFGPTRVIDTPVSENAITGAAIGAAIAGMRPVLVHPRVDFMLYAMDPLINGAANWHYMFGGKMHVPLVIWSIINRGGEQAAQHSQALHALFAHIPGLKVMMPSNAYDAKGLLIAAIEDNNPIVYVDDRWLYSQEEEVPEELYMVKIGKALIKKKGTDITLVAASYMVQEALRACESLALEGIKAEVIDLRTIKPMDEALILASVKKTGRLVIADGGWRTCGFAAEIATLVSESLCCSLKAPIRRVTLPDCPAPASKNLEKCYYPNKNHIMHTARELMQWRKR